VNYLAILYHDLRLRNLMPSVNHNVFFDM